MRSNIKQMKKRLLYMSNINRLFQVKLEKVLSPRKYMGEMFLLHTQDAGDRFDPQVELLSVTYLCLNCM